MSPVVPAPSLAADKTQSLTLCVSWKGESHIAEGDGVCWVNEVKCGHVGYVLSVDPVTILTKDGDQATYVHYPLKWDEKSPLDDSSRWRSPDER